jgi:hypothetical protein
LATSSSEQSDRRIADERAEVNKAIRSATDAESWVSEVTLGDTWHSSEHFLSSW